MSRDGLAVVVTVLLLGLLGAATLAVPHARAEGETYVKATGTTFAPFEIPGRAPRNASHQEDEKGG